MQLRTLGLAAGLLVSSLVDSGSTARATEGTPPSPSRALPALRGGNAALPLQIDGGTDVWRDIEISFQDAGSFATVYVFNQAIGSYKTGIEYWYVDRSLLTRLGSTGISITVTDSSSTTPPSDPGYPTEQRFQQTQSPGWGSGWTTDPYSGGALFAGPSGYYLRVKNSILNPPTIENVIWYQVLPSGTPANIDPAGSWSSSSGSVPVPRGSTGYSVDQSTG